MAHYVIIGNGIAANSAAETIRKADQKCDITMFSKEKVPFYYIPALPEFLSGDKDINDITIHNEQWYKDNGIVLHLNTEIQSIDSEKKSVVTKTGKSFHYDRLLLAAGGYSFIPPIKGSNLDGVFGLRTYADADKIRTKAAVSKELVLIGGGLLGLEAGNGLRKAGLRVTVVEFFPRLLPRQMDAAGAAILQTQMESMGFSFRLGATTQEITQQNGRLCVCLEGGEKLETDMVLVSAGVRPELSLAKAAALEIDKAVKVDDAMKTSADAIYAAGDVIEHRSMFYGIWPAAQDQGKTAGIAMTGGSSSYSGTVPSNTLKVVGISLTAAGNIDADDKLEAIIVQDNKKAVYRKFVIDGNVIAGTILFGDITGSDEIMAAIKNTKDISSLKSDLAKPGFDFSKLL